MIPECYYFKVSLLSIHRQDDPITFTPVLDGADASICSTDRMQRSGVCLTRLDYVSGFNAEVKLCALL